MKISYNQSNSLHCSNVMKDLELCERIGFDYIELRIDQLKKFLINNNVEILIDFFRNSHLKPHSINAIYLDENMFISKIDKEKEEEILEEFYFACDIAKKIGSEYIVVVPPMNRKNPKSKYEGNWKDIEINCIRILKNLSEHALDYNVNLGFEIVGLERSSVRSVEEAKSIVDKVDRENVGYVIDAYNLYLKNGQDSFKSILKLKENKIFAVHIMNADNVSKEDMDQDKRRFCGAGVMELSEFLQNLKLIGYDGMVSIETFRPEYWEWSPEKVIEKAYETTKEELLKNNCLN